ncbi:hypothetical protein MMC30_007590 [Trapelia coarctata]|nr:hypothetical protein [Trapelia coarctata]
MGKTPVYFLSHGGPNVMYEVDHPAYAQLSKIGKEIISLKPDGIVALSAHWQERTIEVNMAEKTDLIYDFYGFPDHYYKEKFPNRGSPVLAQTVLAMLKDQGVQAEGVERGTPDAYPRAKADNAEAFDPGANPLTVPIVQVSIPDTDDPRDYVRLGQAISQLRRQNILIVVTGMAVHNLQDLRFSFSSSAPLPYTVSFDEALKTAVEDNPARREKSMAGLLQRPDARKAHPTLEHLMPIYVGAGAAGADPGKRLWTLKESSMSWAQYRFGEVEAN